MCHNTPTSTTRKSIFSFKKPSMPPDARPWACLGFSSTAQRVRVCPMVSASTTAAPRTKAALSRPAASRWSMQAPIKKVKAMPLKRDTISLAAVKEPRFLSSTRLISQSVFWDRIML